MSPIYGPGRARACGFAQAAGRADALPSIEDRGWHRLERQPLPREDGVRTGDRMTTRGIFLGTAGWSVPRAVAPLFPPEGSALERYAARFRACEINSTFWRRHQPATMERWRKVVPRGFRFAVKLPRAITHDRQLRTARAPLREFFEDVAPLRDRWDRSWFSFLRRWRSNDGASTRSSARCARCTLASWPANRVTPAGSAPPPAP